MFSPHSTKEVTQRSVSAWRRVVPIILVAVSFGCGWGAREARVPPPDPTRVPKPTFTPTTSPLAANPAPTHTRLQAGEIPVPSALPSTNHPTATPSPSPTHTRLPPTSTPVPPTPTPIPPTPTPLPPTPTFTVVAPPSPTAAPRFEFASWWKENNCFELGIKGFVFDAQGQPLGGISIHVVGGDESYTATSSNDGSYAIRFGPLLDYPDGMEWNVQLGDNGQIISDRFEWPTSHDCDDKDEIQVLHLEWMRESVE